MKKGLKSFAQHVESFVHEQCSSQANGAPALEETHEQDDKEVCDNGRARSVDRTAAASSSSTRLPAYIQIPDSPLLTSAPSNLMCEPEP